MIGRDLLRRTVDLIVNVRLGRLPTDAAVDLWTEAVIGRASIAEPKVIGSQGNSRAILAMIPAARRWIHRRARNEEAVNDAGSAEGDCSTWNETAGEARTRPSRKRRGRRAIYRPKSSRCPWRTLREATGAPELTRVARSTELSAIAGRRAPRTRSRASFSNSTSHELFVPATKLIELDKLSAFAFLRRRVFPLAVYHRVAELR